MQIKDSKGQSIRTYPVAKDDYPELEGKIIEYRRDGNDTTGLVVGCNRQVGLTVVEATDKDKYLVCVRGPVTTDPTIPPACEYDELFDLCIEQIEEGYMDAPVLLKKYMGSTPSCSCDGNCAYGQ